VLDALDAPAVRRWSILAADAMEINRAEIDELNVFPVPDGDTGTNLAQTLRAAADALADDPASTAWGAVRAWARGAVLGARGNSGVIVSQILCGLADGIDGSDACDGALLAIALRSAADQAYASVANPLEGTILSVARAAADAAHEAGAAGAGAMGSMVQRVQEAAWAALRRTIDQLPALTQAGVVDAGGRGLVVLIDALGEAVTGTAGAAPPAARAARSRGGLEAARESGSTDYDYEVQYLLRADQPRTTILRSELASLGDSLVVVGTGDGVWNVHVHVNDVGAALEAGVRAGTPYRITVVRFADAVAPQAPPVPRRQSGTAVVAVAPGEGLAHLFESEGVYVVEGGPTDNPSTADVLSAMLSCPVDHVVLLPNASQVSGVAEAAAIEARGQGVEVAVVPTKSPVQGLSAVAVHDASRRFGDDVIAMAEAAAATRWAEVTVAEREALTMAGRCQPGDVLGLIDGEVVEIGSTVGSVAAAIIDRLLAVGGELITILVGREAEPDAGEQLRRHITSVAPHIEVGVFDGGQPHFPLLIGVE
jgi:DAK2 domain fusion protein YloV